MRTLIIVTTLIVSAAPAVAQIATQRGSDDLRLNCAGDALTFCAGIDPNSRQMDACFEKNLSRMSPNCRRSIQAYRDAGGK